jgi:hypothetical protein
VVDHEPSKGATAVVLNRPLGSSVSPQLGALLFGGKKCLEDVFRQRPFVGQDAFNSFSKAFSNAVVYQGGLDDQVYGFVVVVFFCSFCCFVCYVVSGSGACFCSLYKYGLWGASFGGVYTQYLSVVCTSHHSFHMCFFVATCASHV